MNKKNCREALDVYKKFLARMDRVCEFLKVAEVCDYFQYCIVCMALLNIEQFVIVAVKAR